MWHRGVFLSSLVFDLSDTQIDQSLGFIARVWQGFKLFLPVNVEMFSFFFAISWTCFYPRAFYRDAFTDVLFTDVLSHIFEGIFVNSM